MGSIASAFASAFRDYTTIGVPASGAYQPSKPDIRALGSTIEASLGALSLGSVSVTKATRSLLNADLAHAANTVALVYADSTDANNDLYVKSGASGSGSWTLTSILHDAIEGFAAASVSAEVASQVDPKVALAQEWADNPEDDAITGHAGSYSALHWSAKSETFANAASGDADRADSAASAAEATANSIEDARAEIVADAVAAAAAVATSEANRAEAAADIAAANAHFYATKSAASAALSGLTNGEVIEVHADESDFGNRTRYIKNAGAIGNVLARLPKLVEGAEPYFMSGTRTRFVDAIDPVDGVKKPHVMPHVYIDRVNGNDANDGEHGYDYGDGRGPIKTRAAFEAHKHFRNGVTVALKDNGGWHDIELDYAEPNTGNGNNTLSQFSVVPYGNGNKLMKIKGTDPVTKASGAKQSAITAHGSISGAYEVTWTHDMYQSATAFLNMVQKQGNGETQALVRKQNESDCSTAGTFWYDSTLSDAGSERIVFKPWAGVDATTAADGTFEITRRRYAMSGRDNCLFHGFWMKDHGCNNGSMYTYAAPKVSRILCERGGKHNWVLGAGEITDVISVNALPSTGYLGISILGTVFEGDMTGKTAVLTRCGFFCDDTLYTNADSGKTLGSALYAHSTGGGAGTLLQLNDCWNANTGTGLTHTIFSTYEINRHFSRGMNNGNAGIAGGVAFGTVRVRDTLCINSSREFSENGTGVTWDLDRVAVFAGTGGISGGLLYANAASQTMKLRNVVMMSDAGSSTQFISATGIATLSYDVQNCIFGRSLAALDFGTTVADPTYFKSNNNYYDMIKDPGGSGDPYMARYNNHLYKVPPYDGSADKEFAADWQGVLGYDANSGAGQYTNTGANDDSVGWNGSSPTSAHPEYLVLSPSSPMYGKITLLAQDLITEMMARPITRAAAVEYLENDAPRLLVFVA